MDPLWQKTLAHLEQTLTPQHFSTWIKPIHFAGVSDECVHLEVPNRFVLDWVKNHYYRAIQECMSNIAGIPYQLRLSIKKEVSKTVVPRRKE